jgi:hypothetical protein
MALTYIGIDPNTGDGACPTVWVDDETGELVFQGWKVTKPETLAQIKATGPIPETETVVRLPARMASIVREACDVAQRSVVR